MGNNILDCDTYNCPQYNGAHGCKLETVQLENGLCREYLSQLRFNRIEANIEKLIKYIRASGSVKESKLEATTGSKS